MIVINKFEKVVATSKEGEEKTHCCQQHWVSLLEKKRLSFIFIFLNNDNGVDVNIIMII